MMVKLLFVAIAGCLALIDGKKKTIPNIIVIPAIVLGCILTCNIWPTIVMFTFGAMLYQFDFWRGGDVKLVTMVGAFLGIVAVYILLVSIGLIYAYRYIKNCRGALPYAPFMFIASLAFLW